MRVKQAAKWAAIAVAFVVSAATSVLLAFGVPKPPAIHTENVGRVSWVPAIKSLLNDKAPQSRSFAAWLPDGGGMMVRAGRRLRGPRLVQLRSAHVERAVPASLPQAASGFHTAPDGQSMIVTWDEGGDEQYRLYRWTLGESGPMAITPAGERAQFGASEPGGRRIAYTSNRRNGRDADVYLVDPSRPETDRRIAELTGSWSVTDWSPDGSRLLLRSATSNTESRLHMLALGTGELTPLLADGALYGDALWSRTDAAIYYTSNEGTEFLQLRRLDLETGKEVLLTSEIDWDVTSLQMSHDGHRLLIAVNEAGASRYYLGEQGGDHFVPLPNVPTGPISMVLHPDGDRAAVQHVDPVGVVRTYVYDIDAGQLKLWSGRAPTPAKAPGPRLVTFPTFDEVDGRPRQIPAFVYPAAGPGPHPVLISIHGGPEAQARLTSRWHGFQESGVTVITPNVRGSTGYGRSYERLDNGRKREDAVRDIGALLDWVARQPDLDAERVAVVGGSYGGYMVLASLVHYSDHIGCGIDRVGISHFVTFLENTADYRRDLRRAEYGDERDPAMREFLHEISPLTNADKVTAQLMVVQGANDPRVPVTEARQLVAKVEAAGRPVPYVEAADEGHGFKKPWNTFYTNLVERALLTECLNVTTP